MHGLVGRDRERAALARFLAGVGDGPSVLSIVGSAGIGKSSLWLHALELADAAGIVTLVARPAQQETHLAFAGLSDLLARVDRAAIDSLPGPQRVAVSAAALLGPAPADPIDERAIGAGLSRLVDLLAESNPLLIVIDDAHWLDAGSSGALAFALRRVRGAVGVLLSRRPFDSGAHAVDLADALPVDVRRDQIEVPGLSPAAIFVLIRDRLGLALPRVRLTQLVEAAGGNPLLALELAREAEPSVGGFGADLAPPARLDGVLARRLGALSDGARGACLAVACAGRMTREKLRSLELDGGLRDAEMCEILRCLPDRVEFTHPLMAPAALRVAGSQEQRAMHARLACVAEGPEQRARHLAHADVERDAGTAAALDDAAADAANRGAIAAAIELSQLAVDRTPLDDADALWRRKVLLATRLYAAGETAGAVEALDGRDAGCPPGRRRADAELLLVEIAFQSAPIADAIRAAELAFLHAADPVQRARALVSLTIVDPSADDESRLAEALECVEQTDDPDGPTIAWVRMCELYRAQRSGEPVAPADIDALVDIERAGRLWRSADNAASNRPVLLLWIDEPLLALAALDELAARADEEGNEGSIPYLLGHRAASLVALARFDEAAATAARHADHARATGQHGQQVQARYLVATTEAYVGNLDAAADQVCCQLDDATAAGDDWMAVRLAALLGVIEVQLGRFEAACEHLERWHEATLRDGAAPSPKRYYVDHVEALLACGRRERAAQVVDWLISSARRAQRRAPEAAGRHGRALILADAGELASAVSELTAVLESDDVVVNRHERARALLLRGVLRRRLRQKAAARTDLETARALFAEVGAEHFVRRVDDELVRVGQRTVDRFELTASERRVAELAASGLTNRQVADRLFISPKTVEANLSRAYAKLGIHSRAELGATMAELRARQGAVSPM